jgi:hypothetical protein
MMYPEPAHTRVWLLGAKGEEVVGEALDALSDQGVIALHDRRIPGSKANIDHIAVGPSGVFVIDAKHYAGRRVKKDFAGSIFNPGAPQLFIDKRNRTDLVAETAHGMGAVHAALHGSPDALRVPVLPMLTFVKPANTSLRSPIDIAGVWVGRPSAMAKVVSRPGDLSPETVEKIATLLSQKLKRHAN